MLPPRPNVVADADHFRLLRDAVGIGVIHELPASVAGLVAPHIAAHCETFFIAASGVGLNRYPEVFQTGERQLAMEWVRREPCPQPEEPELNINRFLFGLTPGGNCFGYDVTEKQPGVSKEQVADHWSTLNQVLDSYISSKDFKEDDWKRGHS